MISAIVNLYSLGSEREALVDRIKSNLVHSQTNGSSLCDSNFVTIFDELKTIPSATIDKLSELDQPVTIEIDGLCYFSRKNCDVLAFKLQETETLSKVRQILAKDSVVPKWEQFFNIGFLKPGTGHLYEGELGLEPIVVNQILFHQFANPRCLLSVDLEPVAWRARDKKKKPLKCL